MEFSNIVIVGNDSELNGYVSVAVKNHLAGMGNECNVDECVVSFGESADLILCDADLVLFCIYNGMLDIINHMLLKAGSGLKSL